MGKFSEALEAPATPVVFVPCRFGRWFRSIDDDDRAAIRREFAGDMTNIEIAERITAAGYPVSNPTISRHRAGRCEQCRPLQIV